MKVRISGLNVNMEVKNTGVHFEVRDTTDEFLGKFFVKKTGLLWCDGKTKPANGKLVLWEDFTKYAMKHGQKP